MVGGGERERESERETETDRQTDRDGEIKESRSTILGNLRLLFVGDCVEKTHGKLYLCRKVAVAMRFMLGALHEERACRNIVSDLILSSTAIYATLFKIQEF
jgi:hypothetical protein